MSDPIDLQEARQRRRAWEKARDGARQARLGPAPQPKPGVPRVPLRYRTPLRHVPAAPQRPALATDSLLHAVRQLRSSFAGYCTREQLLDQLDDLLYRHEKAPDH